MKEIDFFAADIFREEPRTDNIFGINDAIQEGDHNGMAYTTTDTDNKWNATVKNENYRPVTFEPLDHNIDVKDENNNQYSLCDGMLYTDNNDDLIFVELKDQDKDWISKDIMQLESTIKLFTANHDYKDWKRRSAFAANSKHPQFKFSHRTEMQEFKNATHFSLRIVATINIK